MAAEPDTLVVHGNWGEKYAQFVVEKHKGKCKLDRLASLVAPREGRPRTVFIVAHEPYANQQGARVRSIRKLAETKDAVLVRVDGGEFTDYAAVSFGPQHDRPLQLLGDGKVSVQFRDYAYIRVPRSGAVSVRGGVTGLRLPHAQGRMTVNGRPATAAVQAGSLVYLPAVTTPPLPIEPPCPLAVDVSPKELRAWLRDRKSAVFSIRNVLPKPVAGRIDFGLPDGVAVEPGPVEFGPVPPGKKATVEVAFRVFDPAPGKVTIPFRVIFREEGAGQEVRSRAQSLTAHLGPTLDQQFQFPDAPVYRAVTSNYTAKVRMADGAFVFLADDDDRVRLDGEPLFLLSEGEGDKRVEMLGREPKQLGVWPGHQPPNLVAEAFGRTGKRGQRCRWQAIFNVGSIMFRMDPDWSRFERARFTLPGNWRCAGGKPRWARIVAVDKSGKEREARADDNVTVKAALLDLPDGEFDLAFKFNPPQQVVFQDVGMEFSIRVVPRDRWHIGFCKPDRFEQWRSAR